VNDENAAIDIGHAERQMNISVWLEPGYSRHFGSPYVGMHGYLNNNTDMHGFFLAAGPGIGQNSTMGPINIVDIAPTVLQMLGIESGFDSAGTIISPVYGSRTTAFSIPDMYPPEIKSISITPENPVEDDEIQIEVKVNDIGTIVLSDAVVFVDDVETDTINLEDLGDNHTFYGNLGSFTFNEAVKVEVTVKDALDFEVTELFGPFTIGEKITSPTDDGNYSLFSLIAIPIIALVMKRRRRK
jgi:hypothetical protein